MSSSIPDTRTRILDAAWRLLEKESGGGVRMADIAKAAGLSRQAVYLHFPNRADLLIAVTRHIDVAKDVDARLAESRAAATGRERLDAYVEALGNYFPEVFPVVSALMAMHDDADAASALADRMRAIRHGCAAAVKALDRDGDLAPDLTVKQATDVLWTLLSFDNWARLVRDCGWSQKRFVEGMQRLARRALVRG